MKGVTKAAQKRFTHERFLKCLETQLPERAPNYRIRSDRHQLFTTRSNKLCLSAYDDKRFIFKNGKETLPFGHFEINDDVFMREILKDWNLNMDTKRNSSGGETIHGSQTRDLSISSVQSISSESYKHVDWGFLQRDYSTSELEVDIANTSNEVSDNSTPQTNEFILNEAEESPDTPPIPRKRRKKRQAIIYSDSS